MARVVIFANGELPDARMARRMMRADDVIVCADGGTHHALALGLVPNIILGDLDSLSETDRSQIDATAVPVRSYSRDKDQTDLELALDYALQQNAESIWIIAAAGKRLDQTIANVALLSDARLSTLDVRLDDGREEAFFCRGQSQVFGSLGDSVSLIPWGGVVTGVRTENLKWPLSGDSLYPEKTRGISNEMTGQAAGISIQSGLLLVIHSRQT